MLGLHEKQKKILEYLLECPDGAPLDDIAAHLKITRTAAKEHLVKVGDLGLLSFQDRGGFVGRPRRHYKLSPEGHEIFPRQYSWLSNVLLGFLADEMSPEAVKGMMERLAKRVVTSMQGRFDKQKSSKELFEEICRVLNELGYRASLKQSDLRKGAVIEATNCVYHSVAKENPSLCAFDRKLIELASGGMNVKLESCIARGGSVCRFCVRKPN